MRNLRDHRLSLVVPVSLRAILACSKVGTLRLEFCHSYESLTNFLLLVILVTEQELVLAKQDSGPVLESRLISVVCGWEIHCNNIRWNGSFCLLLKLRYMWCLMRPLGGALNFLIYHD